MEVKICKICKTCGEEKPITNFNNKGGGYRSAKCRKCMIKARIEAGLCRHCKKPQTSDSTYCRSCLDKLNKSLKKRNRLDRKAALKHYGGECQYCGEKEIIFLTIDHINDDGAEHRGKINKSNFYGWLRRNNYPKGFQTLCYNCNCTKANYSIEAIKEAIQKAKSTPLQKS